MQAWSWSGFFDYLFNGYLLMGVVTTLWLTAFSITAGLVLGFALALMRLRRGAPAVVARAYIWVFRGTPLLVQLIIIYTGLPQLGLKLSVVQSALLGLSLNEAA
jgi:polar amino acid transport system permease protein